VNFLFISAAAAPGEASPQTAMLIAGIIVAGIIINLVYSRVKKSRRAASPAQPAQVVAAVAEPVAAPLAKGSCGDVKLFDVPDRIAAMVMSIVADELGAPLNELRFVSIKEVEGKS